MRKLCTLCANLSGLKNSLQPYNDAKGKYYHVDLDAVIRFGGTQLQAKIQWKEEASTSATHTSVN